MTGLRMQFSGIFVIGVCGSAKQIVGIKSVKAKTILEQKQSWNKVYSFRVLRLATVDVVSRDGGQDERSGDQPPRRERWCACRRPPARPGLVGQVAALVDAGTGRVAAHAVGAEAG